MFQACCCSCEWLNQSFTGLSALPGGLTSVVGTWTVASDVLTPTTSNGIVSLAAGGGPDYHVRITATIGEGDGLRVLLGYLDADNWLGVEWFNDGNGWIIKYLSCASGTVTELNAMYVPNPGGSDPRTFYAGIQGTKLYASSNNNHFASNDWFQTSSDSSTSLREWETSITPPGTGLAVGSGTIASGSSFSTIVINKWDAACVTLDLRCVHSRDPLTVDGTPPPNAWEVRSGTWTTTAATNTLSVAAGGGLLLHKMKLAPGGTITFDNPHVGSRLVIAYTDDDNYLFAEYTDGFLTPYRRVGGVDTQFGWGIQSTSFGADIFIQIGACYDGTWLYLSGLSSSLGRVVNSMSYAPGFTGTRAGVASSGTGTIKLPTLQCAAGFDTAQVLGFYQPSVTHQHDRLLLELPAFANKTACADCADLAGTYTLIGEHRWSQGWGYYGTFPGVCATTSLIFEVTIQGSIFGSFLTVKLYMLQGVTTYATYNFTESLGSGPITPLTAHEVPYVSGTIHANNNCNAPTDSVFLTWTSA